MSEFEKAWMEEPHGWCCARCGNEDMDCSVCEELLVDVVYCSDEEHICEDCWNKKPVSQGTKDVK